MFPVLAINFASVGTVYYDTERWRSTWPSSKAGYIPSPLQAPETLPENMKVISSVEEYDLFGGDKYLVLEGDKDTISKYESNARTNAWYSFIYRKEKDYTFEVLNEFEQPKDRSILFNEIRTSYVVGHTQPQNWKLFPWFITGTQSIGSDAACDYYYRKLISADGYTVYVIYNNFSHDQPRIVYFMFNSDRTRMITVDVDIFH